MSRSPIAIGWFPFVCVTVCVWCSFATSGFFFTRNVDAADKTEASKGSAKTSDAKKTAPAVVKPFEKLPATVDLPTITEPGKAEQKVVPTKLGAVAVPNNFICLVHMIGGRNAGPGREQFFCEPANDDLHVREWQVRVGKESEEPNGPVIAKLSIQGNDFFFQWTDAAATNSPAPYLCNCAIKLVAGASSHLICFRKPLRAAPLMMDLEETSDRWEIPTPPRADQIRIEAKLPSSKDARFRILGNSILSKANDSLWVEYGLKSSDKALRLKVEAAFGKSIKLTVTPYLQLATQPHPVRFNPGSTKKMKENLDVAIAQAEAKAKLLTPSKGKSPPPTAAAALTEINQQLKTMKLARSQLDHVDEIQKTFESKPSIQMRVYRETEGALVDLLLTSGGPKQKKK